MSSPLEDYFNSLGPSMREPRAELRQAAANLHEQYMALILEGFDREEAMTILLHFMNGGVH